MLETYKNRLSSKTRCWPVSLFQNLYTAVCSLEYLEEFLANQKARLTTKKILKHILDVQRSHLRVILRHLVWLILYMFRSLRVWFLGARPVQCASISYVRSFF